MRPPDQLAVFQSTNLTEEIDGESRRPGITQLEDGRLVAVWTQLSNTADRYDVFAQFLTADGTPIGDPFPVNTTAALDQISPQVVALGNGGFVVLWDSFGQDHFEPYLPDDEWGPLQYGVYQQVFDANGDPVGEETRVNTALTMLQQKLSLVLPLSDGGYVVTFRHDNSVFGEDRGSGTYLQRFDVNGLPVGNNELLEFFQESSEPTLRNPYFTGLGELSDGSLSTPVMARAMV